MTTVTVDEIEYELKDHQLCGVGGKYNCSKCRYLNGCSRGYENHALDDSYRNKQMFKMANPNIA